MGAVAARLSDLVIVTSDNPRSENPDEIIEEIKRGIVMPPDRMKGQTGAKATPYYAIADRRAAIERAVHEARSGDLVVVAGGHEKYGRSAIACCRSTTSRCRGVPWPGAAPGRGYRAACRR